MGHGVPVVDVNSILHSFLLMHSVVNEKEAIVKHYGEININNN